MTKTLTVEDSIHKKLKLISTLSLKSIKRVVSEILNESVNDILTEALKNYLNDT